MTWTAPMTAVANTVFTAAQFNTHVRDNLNETAPAKATAAGRIFVTNGVNSIVERVPTTNTVATDEATSSTSYVALTTPGPAVTVTTGTQAFVIITSRITNSTATQPGFMAYDISGATSFSASDTRCLRHETAGTGEFNRSSYVTLHTGLTAGSNTFTAKYRVAGGTGNFTDRELAVIPL